MITKCELATTYLNEVLSAFLVHIIVVHQMYQGLVKLCKVVSDILAVNTEEVKH